MIGLRIGPVIGPRVGMALGINADPIAGAASNPLAGVSRDATSLVYCPATAGEWTTLLAAANDTVGGPSALWLCQEASGNLADSIGAFPLTASGTGLTYAQAVTGWSRKGILSNDGGTGVFTSTDAGLPDVSTTSIAILMYFVATKPVGGNRFFMSLGTTTTIAALVQLSGVGRCLSGANSALGAVDASGTMTRPWILMHNKTGSADQVYNDAEKITPTFSALTTGKQLLLQSAAHAPGLLTYATAFFGAAAERTSTQWKTLLTTLGYSPAFS